MCFAGVELMLGGRSTGRRDGGERLDALALDEHQTTETGINAAL